MIQYKRTSKERILVFGGSGMVGSRLVQLLSPLYSIFAPTRSQVDLLDKKSVRQYIERFKPQHIIYAAGVADIEKAEILRNDAFHINAKALEYITKYANEQGSAVHYFSTNAVFDGTLKTRSYTEKDKTNPVSIYGKSKVLGEEIVLRAAKKNSVIRLIMVYSNVYTRRLSFTQKILSFLQKKETVVGITDQFANPTFVDDAVFAINVIIKNKKAGIFHLGSLNAMSNFEFIQELAKTYHIDNTSIVPATFAEFYKMSNVQRPQYGSLDVSKFTKTFGGNILHTIQQDLLLFKNQT